MRREVVVVLSCALFGCRGGEMLRPSETASARCGDGVVAANGAETCDDGNTRDGDGCSEGCALELGWACSGNQPSLCLAVCGDGLRRGAEACDEGRGGVASGCTADCRVRRGWTCDEGSPSVCLPVCGDGALIANEQCDDGNGVSGDGCDLACRVEPGFACESPASACAPICGDGRMVGTETCDDGNTRNGDGCNALCVRVDRWRPLAVSAAENLPLAGFLLPMLDEILMLASDGWRPRAFNPTTHTWRLLEPSPISLTSETSLVSTGREIFAYSMGSGDRVRSTLFDVRTNHWHETSSVGVPEIAVPRVIVWTGEFVLLWGRSRTDGRSIGARYDPARDVWSPMRSTDVSTGADRALKGVWTGRELVMVSWSARDGLITLGYDPVRDEWRALPALNAPVLSGEPVVALAGEDVLVFSYDFSAGATYRPSTDSWNALTLPGPSSPSILAPGGWFGPHWTGSELLFVNRGLGRSSRYIPALREWSVSDDVPNSELLDVRDTVLVNGEIFAQTSKYTPALDETALDSIAPVWFQWNAATSTWEELANGIPTPQSALETGAVLAGQDVFFFGGFLGESPGDVLSIAAEYPLERPWAYSTTTGSWRELSPVDQPDPRKAPLLVWTGTEVIVWGGQMLGWVIHEPVAGGLYNPQFDAWRLMSPGDRAPGGDSIAVWSGEEMFVWSPPQPARNDPPFAAYNPQTDIWRPILAPDAPEDGLSGAVRWNQELLFHGRSGVRRYDLMSGTWRAAATENSPFENVTPLADPVVTASGDALYMLVDSDLGRYEPARDAWERIEVPDEHRSALARSGTAIFTGSVVVFLPQSRELGNYDPIERSSPIIGVVYDPSSHRWWNTPSLDAPLRDVTRTYTWTGSELVVWGGNEPGGILPL